MEVLIDLTAVRKLFIDLRFASLRVYIVIRLFFSFYRLLLSWFFRHASFLFRSLIRLFRYLFHFLFFFFLNGSLYSRFWVVLGELDRFLNQVLQFKRVYPEFLGQSLCLSFLSRELLTY